MPKVHPVRTEVTSESRPISIRQVPRHVEFKLKLSTDLELTASVLGLDQPSIKANRFVQLDVIRSVPVAIEQKRCIRKVAFQHATPTKGFGFQMWKARQQQLWAKMRATARDIDIKFELWRSHIKEIDGHFGPGVVSYFTFLKTLFKMNAFISILLLVFVVLPGSFLKQRDGTSTIYNATVSESACYMEKCDYVNSSTVALAPFCSANYLTYTVNSTAKVNPSTHIEILNFTEDFITGSGWMEFSAVFQGYYLSSSLDLSISILDFNYSYNLPLAYIIVTGVYMMSSLFILAAGSAEAIKINMAKRSKNVKKCSFLAFSSWSFGLTSEYSAKLVHNQIRREAKALLAADRDIQRRKQFTTAKKCRVYLIRLVINVFVLVILSCASYLIVFVTDQSTKLRSTFGGFVKLLISYTPSLTLAVLNIVLPSLFEKISRWEDYTPENMLNMSLIRSVVVRLAGLVVLVVTLYRQVTCADSGYSTHVDECGVHNSSTLDCPQLYCWETYVGQQFYKLALMQLFIFAATTLLIDFPRRLIVTKCSFKLAQKLGQPEFNLSVNVMKLVYLQTVCWFGTFFAPVLPSMVFLQLFIIFYLKKVSLLMNYKRNEDSITFSEANRFLVVLLLLSFVLTMVALSYVVTKLPPSKGCGPFRIYDSMYDVVHVTMCSWPCRLLQVFSFITSATFLAPLLLAVAVTATYYLTAVASVHKARYKTVTDQLKTEIENRKELLKAIAAARITHPPANGNANRVVPKQEVVESNLPMSQERSFPQKGRKMTASANTVNHEAAESHVRSSTLRNERNKSKPTVSGGPLTDIVVESPATLLPRDSDMVQKIMIVPSVASVGLSANNDRLLVQGGNYNHNFSTITVQSTGNAALFTQRSSYINVVQDNNAASMPNPRATGKILPGQEVRALQPHGGTRYQHGEAKQLASNDKCSKHNPSDSPEENITIPSGASSHRAVTISEALAQRNLKASTGSLRNTEAPTSQAATASESLALETNTEVITNSSTLATAFSPSAMPMDLPKLEHIPASQSSDRENSTTTTKAEIADNSLLQEATGVASNGQAVAVVLNAQILEEIEFTSDKVESYSDKSNTESESLSLETFAGVPNDASAAITPTDFPQLEENVTPQNRSTTTTEHAAITQAEILSNAFLRELTDAASNGKTPNAILNPKNFEESEFASDNDTAYSNENETESESLLLETSAGVYDETFTENTVFAPTVMSVDLPILEQSIEQQDFGTEATENTEITHVKITDNSLSREATDVASNRKAVDIVLKTQYVEEMEFAPEKDNINSHLNNTENSGIFKNSVQGENDLSQINEYTPFVTTSEIAENSDEISLKYNTDTNTQSKTQADDVRSQALMDSDSSLPAVESPLPKRGDSETSGTETNRTTMAYDHNHLREEQIVTEVEATTVPGVVSRSDTTECSLATVTKVSITERSSEDLVASDSRSYVSIENHSLFGDSIYTSNEDSLTASGLRQEQVPTPNDSLCAAADLVTTSGNVALDVNASVNVGVERHLPSNKSFTMESSVTVTAVVASSHALAGSNILELENAPTIHVYDTVIPTLAPLQQTQENYLLPFNQGRSLNEFISTDVSHDQLSVERNLSVHEAQEESHIEDLDTRFIPVVTDGDPLMLDQQVLPQNSDNGQVIYADVTEHDLSWLDDSALAPIDDSSVIDKLSDKTSSESNLSW